MYIRVALLLILPTLFLLVYTLFKGCLLHLFVNKYVKINNITPMNTGIKAMKVLLLWYP
jgi:hypothetical protein